jgi:Flp pilus assembly protein TadD
MDVFRFRSIIFATLVFLVPAVSFAQEGGGHTLYGDLRVEPRDGAGLTPHTFQVLLYTAAGNVLARQSVPANGRYEFMNIRNGEYQLAVELEEREIVRIPLTVFMMKKTDIRRDIALEWREEPRYRQKQEGGAVAVGDLYERKSENADLWKQALEASARQDYSSAIAHLERMVAADPKDFQAWTELGSVYHNRGSLEEAEKAYDRALKENGSYALAFLNYGKLRMVQKKYESAVEMLSRSVELKPDRAEAHLLLGEAYLQLKRGSKAVEPLNEALRLDPAGMAEAHLRLAALYNGAGLKDKAAEEYEKFLAKKPDSPERDKLLKYINENKKP